MSLTYGFCMGDEDTLYDSAQFSDAFRAVFGDGITPYGSQFSVSINGMTATVAPGYALAAGRWVENDEQMPITLRASGNNDDRTDALVARVDYPARKAALEVLVGVDAAAIRSDSALLRTDGSYSLLLYLIEVHRGATAITPADVTDVRADPALCGYLQPVEKVAAAVLTVYRYLTKGLDEAVGQLIEKSLQAQQKAENAVEELSGEIQANGAAPAIGEILLSLAQPIPAAQWLLCAGGAVPDRYPALRTMLDGVLPDISPADNRFKAYIYGGKPAGGES